MIDPDPAPEGDTLGHGIEAVDETPKTRRRPRARKDVASETVASPMVEAQAPAPVAEAAAPEEAPATDDAAKPKRRSRAKKAPVAELAEPDAAPAELAAPEVAAVVTEAPAKPKPTRAKAPAKVEAEAVATTDTATLTDDPDSDEPRRSGWWSRTFG